MQKNLLQNLGQNKIYFYTKETIMIGGCYGLQVHSNTNNFVISIGFLCKAGGSYTIENRSKRYYNPSTKTKT